MNDQATPTFYEVLGVACNASAAEMRDAYRLAARRLHPDTPDAPADADSQMATLNHAYETLNNPSQRRAYDNTLRGLLTAPNVTLDDSDESYAQISLEESPAGSSPLSAAIAVLGALAPIFIGLGFAMSAPGVMVFGLLFAMTAMLLTGLRYRQAMKPSRRP
jgi:curved DNA-binding protein CbpA